MLFKYKHDMPIVRITVSGELKQSAFDAYIDYASSKTIIPYGAADELGLTLKEFMPTATGAGVIFLPLYVAKVNAFGKNFDIRVGCLDLPEEGGISALLGRDILDLFKVCLNGKRKEIIVSDP